MTDTVRVPRAWLEAFCRDTDPTEPIADNGGTVWDMFCHEAAAMLAASPQGEGSSADAAPIKPSADTGELRERVAQIIGEAVNRRAPGQIVFSTLEDADAILDLIQSEKG